MLKHPQRILISSYKVENGMVITPLFNFYRELELQCPKFTFLFNILLGNALIVSFSQWLMLKEKEMKTLCQEL